MTTAIVWFRRDLRLADQPALLAALDAAECVIPVFLYTPGSSHPWGPGSASRWWLHHSLKALDGSLRARGSGLIIRQGDELASLRQLIAETRATRVYWSRLYETLEIVRDSRIKQTLLADGITVESFNGSLLYEPWEVRRGAGEPYRIFTPFWKAMQALGLQRPPEPAPPALPPLPAGLWSAPLEALELLPHLPWDAGFYTHWTVGEQAAWERLETFTGTGLARYKGGRDLPGEPGTSRLSPHLHFGEISPRQIVSRLVDGSGVISGPGPECFLRELGWREFAYHLLFHFPHTADQPLDERFLRLPWRSEYREDLKNWQHGRTGFPIIDAGLRELWHTGWMHNPGFSTRCCRASALTRTALTSGAGRPNWHGCPPRSSTSRGWRPTPCWLTAVCG